MARSELQILIDLAADEAFRDAQRLKNEFDDLDNTTRKAGGGFDDFGGKLSNLQSIVGGVTAGVAGAAAVFKTAFDLAQQGNAIQQTEARLIALAGSAEEAERATRLLKEAADEGISTFQAQQAAADFLGRGLAKTADEAAELARIALVLGDSTLSASERINNFNLLLANQSIQRLDTFGLSAAQVRAKMDELATAANDGRSEMEFFTDAVRELGGQRLGELEAAGVQASSSVDQLYASLQDLGNELLERVTPGLLSAAQASNLLLNWQKRTNEVLEQNAANVAKTADNYDEYVKTIIQAGVAGNKYSQSVADIITNNYEESRSLEEVTRLLEYHGYAVELLNGAQFTQIPRTENLAFASNILTGAQQQLNEQMQRTAMVSHQVTGGLDEAGEGLDNTANSAKKAAEELDAVAEAEADIQRGAPSAVSALDAIRKGLLFEAAGGGTLLKQFDDLALAWGGLTDEQQTALMKEAAGEAAALDLAVGNIASKPDAIRQIIDSGVTSSWSEATKLLESANGYLDSLEGRQATANITLAVDLQGDQLSLTALSALFGGVPISTIIQGPGTGSTAGAARNTNNNAIPILE